MAKVLERPVLTCLLSGLLLAFAAVTACAAEQTITLTEHLNRTWNRELVEYPFTATEGACVANSVTLTGPRGAQPVQLADVANWPGTTFVKSARLAFLVETLAPLTTNTYTVSYGPAPAPAPAPVNLSIVRRDGSVEVITDRFGARLLLGEQTFDAPRPAVEAPGPVRGLRLTDGAWFGGSRLCGEGRIRSWSSRLVDAGPVIARVDTTYTYADGNTLRVRTALAAGDYALQCTMTVQEARPNDGWELLLRDGVAITEGVKIIGSRNLAQEVPFTIAPGADPVCYLSPWVGDRWFPDSPALLRLKLAGRNESLQLSIRDAGAWVAPRADFPWKNFAQWGFGMVGTAWQGWTSKRIPLFADGGGVLLRMNLLDGQRKWTLGASADGKRFFDSYTFRETGAYTPLPRLNEVKEMVLDWPDGVKHPCLYADAREMAALGERDPAAYRDALNAGTLQGQLQNLGALDYMRNVIDIAVRYDNVIDSPQLAPQERKLMKAQTAFLAYLDADPFHWSYERGYCSGNPNMTVSRYTGLGFLGCALRDHPMGQVWAQRATDWMRCWLREVTDDSGSWPESSHYARVSWANFVAFAVIARKAGLYDFYADPKFRQMALFYEKTLTPPHPDRRTGNDPALAARVTPWYGRGNRGDAWGLSGLLASATAETDPAFSRVMQWSWRASGYNTNFSHGTGEMAQLLINRELPVERPGWTSEFLPTLGYLLRSRVGEPDENYLLFVTEYLRSADGEIWPPDTGSICNWYADGKPIAGNFVRVPETSHPLTVNRVSPATNWDPRQGVAGPGPAYVTETTHDEFTLLPGSHYCNTGFTITAANEHHLAVPRDMPAFPRRERTGATPLRWRRQLLQVTGEHQYLVLRDTVTGGQPTQWQFWTTSRKVGTPAEMADRQAFLADAPGNTPAPLRQLTGNRFTAAGQHGVDLDYYIAAPGDTPRYTLRYGVTGSAYGIVGRLHDYQDLLYLQLPGDGAYFTALFPHRPEDPAPRFATLGDGTVITVTGEFGTDYCFLSPEEAAARAGDAAFTGTAGLVQDRAEGLLLSLPAPGRVAYRQYALSGPVAANCRLSADRAVLTVGADGGTVTLRLPGAWSAAPGQAGVTLTKRGADYQVTVPAGTGAVTLRKKGR